MEDGGVAPDRMVRAMARRWADGDDVLEECLIEVGLQAAETAAGAWRAGGRASITSWCYMPVRRAFQKAARRRARSVVLTEMVAAPETPEEMSPMGDRPSLADVPWWAITGRMRTAVQLRYGLGDDRPMTYGQVGARLGVSEQRAHALVTEAIQRLRNAAESYTLDLAA
jgi:DNA-directed RNA polymerase specialized sigma24 family protein